MKRNKKIYICGPITGVPGAISAAHFARAEQDLRELGFCNIINPRFMFEGTGLTWDEIMKHCLDLVCSADAVILLPRWKHRRDAHAARMGTIWPTAVYRRLWPAEGFR